MDSFHYQFCVIFVPADSGKSPINFVLSGTNSTTIRDVKYSLATKLGCLRFTGLEFVVAEVLDNRIVAVLDDEFFVNAGHSSCEYLGQDRPLYAFEMNDPPNNNTLHNLLRESDKAYKMVYNGILYFPILLRCDDGEKSMVSTKFFGCPRLLALTTRIFAEELHELIERVVPQGKYTVHYVNLKGYNCSKCVPTKNCNGCKVRKFGLIGLNIGEALAVHYRGTIPEIPAIEPYTSDMQASICKFQELLGSKSTNRTSTKLEKNQQTPKLDPFDNLKFSGREDSIHPKRFLETFESFAIKENLDEEGKEYYFIKSLVQNAARRLKIIGYGSYQEMKSAFIKFYWGPRVQGPFLKQLRSGKYTPKCGLSMWEYFYKYAKEAKYLDDAPSEVDVIKFLIGHFDDHVKSSFQGKTVRTIDEAAEVLMDLEAENKQEISEFTQVSEVNEPRLKLNPVDNLVQTIEKAVEVSVNLKTDERPEFLVLSNANCPNNNIKLPGNLDLTEDAAINKEMNDETPQQQTTLTEEQSFEVINASESSGRSINESSITSESEFEIWEDCFCFKYEKNKDDGKLFYKCMTAKLWPLHCIKNERKSVTNIQNFDIHFGMTSKKELPHGLEPGHFVYIDVDGNPRAHEVLGPITVARQVGNQLMISTSLSFKSSHCFVAGQVLFVERYGYFIPCSIVTYSISEGDHYRYIISNHEEQIVCLSCEDTIESTAFCKSRPIAVDDLDVFYSEQDFLGNKRLLRFLNENFAVVYTVWDTATVEYDPLFPNYH